MVGRWDCAACLTLCAVAAPSLASCQGGTTAIAAPPPTDDASTVDVSSTLDGEGTTEGGTDDAPDDVGTEPAVADAPETGASLDAGSDRSTLDTTIVFDARDIATCDGGLPGPILYPTGLIHSPITASVAMTMRRIGATVPMRDSHNFLKAGDTIMGNALGFPDQVSQSDFFGCVESPVPMKDLGDYAWLQATIDYVRQGNIGGRTAFSRVSQCTRENFTSWDLLSMNLLPAEIAATNPSFAFVMFGSIDILTTGTFEPSPRNDWLRFREYGQAMLDIEDTLIAAGIIPVVISMPPRAWEGGAPVVQSSTYVALTRAITQGRQTPFVDFYLPMQKLADRGLDRDGLHITQYDIGTTTANCVFSEEGLKHGYNLLNLYGLQALERVKLVIADGACELEESAPVLAGEGTPDAPFEVPYLPFSDLRDLAKATSRARESYARCGDAKETGGEYFYRWNAAGPTRVRAVVVDKKGSPIEAHVYHLAGAPSADACVPSQSWNPSNGGLSAGTLEAGAHYFAVDSSSVPAGKAAEYMLVLIECDPTDATCK
jgi:hypothetical protein